MSVVQRILSEKGSYRDALRRMARTVLQFHLPAHGVARPFCRGCYALHVFTRETLIWLLRFFWYEPLFRSQCARVGPRLQMEQLPYLTGRGRIVVGAGVQLSGKSSICFNNRHHHQPQIMIGDNTFIGHNCALIAGCSITVGRDCLIAGRVRISDQDGHPLDAERRRAGEPTPAECIKPVVVGNDVWIGEGAVILKGVQIGDRAIVGARAVVTKDVSADTVVAGNPARTVKSLPGDRVPSAA